MTDKEILEYKGSLAKFFARHLIPLVISYANL